MGSVDNGSIPVWWQDGVVTYGSGTKTGANVTIVTSATVDGADVYHGGYRFDPLAKPVYWKNGNMISIPTLANESGYVLGVTIANGDLYCLGVKQEMAGPLMPAYWVNGKVTTLPATASGLPAELVVSGNDVYILGYDDIVPVVWKNGVKSVLETSGTVSVTLTCLTVVGNDVYAGGGVDYEAAYWKNGKLFKLPGSGTPPSFGRDIVNDIFIKGNDVHLVGTQTKNLVNTATHWLNGSLAVVDQEKSAEATAIWITDSGVIYIAGILRSLNENPTPVYWRDGTRTALSSTSLPFKMLYARKN